MKKSIVVMATLLALGCSTSYAANIYAPYVPAYVTKDNKQVYVKSDLDVKVFTDKSVETWLQTEVDDPNSPYLERYKYRFVYFMDDNNKLLGVWYSIERKTIFIKGTDTIVSGNVKPTMLSPTVEGYDEYNLAMYAYRFAQESGKLAQAAKKPVKSKKQ